MIEGEDVHQPGRLAGIAVKRQPGAEHLLVELAVAETGIDDGADALARVIGAGEAGHGIGAELRQQVAHGGEEQLVLVLGIVVYHPGRNAGLGSDARHGGIGEAMRVDGGNCRLHQLLAPDWRHSELRHFALPCRKVSFFIGQLSNENLPSPQNLN